MMISIEKWEVGKRTETIGWCPARGLGEAESAIVSDTNTHNTIHMTHLLLQRNEFEKRLRARVRQPCKVLVGVGLHTTHILPTPL